MKVVGRGFIATYLKSVFRDGEDGVCVLANGNSSKRFVSAISEEREKIRNSLSKNSLNIYLSTLEVVTTSRSEYAVSKLLAEQVLPENSAILRLCGTSGHGMRKGITYDIFTGGRLFNTLDSRLKTISIFTVKEAIEAIMRDGLTGVWHVLPEDTITPDEIIKQTVGDNVKFLVDVKADFVDQTCNPYNSLIPGLICADEIQSAWQSFRDNTYLL